MTFSNKLNQYFKAKYCNLSIDSHEESRVLADIKAINVYRKEKAVTMFTWDCINGLERFTDSSVGYHSTLEIPTDTEEPLMFLSVIKQWLRDNTASKEEHPGMIIIIKDFHLQLEKSSRIPVIRMLRNIASLMSSCQFMFIFISPEFKIPLELQKQIQKVDYKLPNDDDIVTLFDFCLKSNKLELSHDHEIFQKVVAACKGLTENEIRNAISLSLLINRKRLDQNLVSLIFDEKIQLIKKDGLLEYIPSKVSFDQIGGVAGLKKFIRQRKKTLSKEAREFGIPNPKGILVAGPPGCGKTLLGMGISLEFGWPLFKLDIGTLFNSHVGESEANFRRVTNLIDALDACVVLIDEVEKSFHTEAVNGRSDSGTSSRTFGTFLTWMNDRTSKAFLVATSNDHTILPPPLIRPGRFDQLFWVDLPNELERQEIFEVVLNKYKKDVKLFNITELAKSSKDFTGAEIDEVVKQAMITAFDVDEQVTTEQVLTQTSTFKAWAVVNPDEIKKMRSKAKNKLKMASDNGDIVEVEIDDEVDAHRAVEI